jgi:hypothetical protein
MNYWHGIIAFRKRLTLPKFLDHSSLIFSSIRARHQSRSITCQMKLTDFILTKGHGRNADSLLPLWTARTGLPAMARRRTGKRQSPDY